jgi:ADYC domain
MQTQGTSLQGAREGIQTQGASLQGAAHEYIGQQGTSVQGGAAQDLRRHMGSQGISYQGTGLQGNRAWQPEQGTSLQGTAARRAYRGIGDLNGAHLTLTADPNAAVTVRDGELVATGYPTTESLRGVPLTATAPDGRHFAVALTAITIDGRTRRLELTADGLPICDPDQQGMFVPGHWDARGAHAEAAGELTYSCGNGVIAKCVAWGYAPWSVGADVHAGCTRMARADYCGDGTPWTMDGTLINMFDQLGVNSRSSSSGMKFEAGWSAGGAVCAARTRYQIHDGEGRVLEPSCFAALPACDSLEQATALGAVVANQSAINPIDACP